jgi:hypothetical protein
MEFLTRTALETLPPNAIVLCSGDLQFNAGALLPHPPFTLKPQTLCLSPQPPNPKPWSPNTAFLDPMPQTRNPKPETRNRKA